MSLPVMPPEPIPGSARKVAFTPAARRVLAAVRRRDGQQAVLLAWPAGVAYLPLAHYVPNAFDVIVGHVEGCPVYADTRRLALFRNSHIILDAARRSPSRRHPTLSVRTLTAGKPDRDTAATRPAAAVEPLRGEPDEGLLRELGAQFAGTFSSGQISRCARNAIDDLLGSVSREALPEMAARLAHHRLRSAMRRRDIHDSEDGTELNN